MVPDIVWASAMMFPGYKKIFSILSPIHGNYQIIVEMVINNFACKQIFDEIRGIWRLFQLIEQANKPWP